jgi:hypothetical protein
MAAVAQNSSHTAGLLSAVEQAALLSLKVWVHLVMFPAGA